MRGGGCRTREKGILCDKLQIIGDASIGGARESLGSVPDARRRRRRVISETIAERGPRGIKEMKWEKV